MSAATPDSRAREAPPKSEGKGDNAKANPEEGDLFMTRNSTDAGNSVTQQKEHIP